ncbi:MAG: hypothetical protein ACUVV6_04935 [Thermoplasmatota archaeon]
MGELANIWEGLLQKVLEANVDLVSTRRLKGHLDRLAEKYPGLAKVTISEGRVRLAEGFPEDDSGLMTVCIIIGALYWSLDMFTGPSAALDRVRKPVRKFLRERAPGKALGLNRFLPKLHLEAEGEERTRESAPAAGGAGGEPAGAALGSEVGREEGAPRKGAAEGAGKGFEGVGGAGTGGGAGEGPGRLGAGRWRGGDVEAGGGSGEVEAGTGGTEELAEAEELAPRFSGVVPWLGEELPRGCSILVEGQDELKERVCLRFIKEGLERGEAALVLISYPPEEFRRRMAEEGLETAVAEQQGLLQILDWATFRERHVYDLEDEGSVKRLPMELPHVGAAINLALQELHGGGSPRAFVNILPRALATVAIETVFNFVAVTILKFKRREMTALFTMGEEKDPEKAAIRLSFNSSVEIQEAEAGRVSVRVRGPLLRGKLKVMRPEGGALVVESEQLMPAEEASEPDIINKMKRELSDWRAQGYEVGGLEELLRNQPERARKEFERCRRAIEGLKDIRSDLKIMDLTGVEVEAAKIQDMTRDPERLPEVEEAMRRLRQRFQKLKEERAREEARAVEPGGEAEEIVEVQMEEAPAERVEAPREAGEKRREFREALERWRAEGYSVAELDRVIEGDIEEVRRAFVLFRVQLQRLRELKEELDAIEAPALQERRAALAPLLKDVSRIPEIERALAEMRAGLARMEEEGRARRAEEQKRRAALSERVFWWHSQGINVSELERLLEGDLEAAEAAFAEFEKSAKALLELKENLSRLDTSDFPEEAAALEALLGDVRNLRDAEEGLVRLRERVRLNSTRARETRELMRRVEALRARGFAAERVLGLAEKDIRLAERELHALEASAELMAGLIAQLEGMDTRGFEERARALRERMRDPARLEECRRELLSLRHELERARAEEREREECRKEIEGWKRLGLQTGAVEAALTGDITALRQAMIKFRLDLQLHDELMVLLEPLLEGKRAAEASELQKELKDFSRLPELEKRVLELRLGFEEEALARGREGGRALEAELVLHDKLVKWLESGYKIRRLESALRADPESLRAEVERLDSDIDQLSKLASALDVLDTKGHEKEVAHIRSMLNDPDKLATVRSMHEALKLEISRRKREEERRSALRAVLKEWREKGYATGLVENSIERDLERAAQEVILLKLRIAAAEHLRARIDVLEALGYDREAAKLREQLLDPAALENVRERVEKLLSAAEERARGRAGARLEARRRRAELRDRLLAWAAQGLVVRRLELALEGPLDKAAEEFSRFEEDVKRLRALEAELASIDARGFEAEALSIRTRLGDVDKIKEIEEGIRALRERVEAAKREEEKRRAEEEARKLEAEREAAARQRLEERLVEWSGFGYDVEPLRAALSGNLAEAEAKFASFENSMYRTEELRVEFHELLTRGVGDVPGVETLEGLLQDPLKLPQAERAFAAFKRRVEEALETRSAEMRALAARVAELRASGEDVAGLEEAMSKGVGELRAALQEFERQRRLRGLEATWKGIKSALKGQKPPERGGGEAEGEERSSRAVKKRKQRK